VRFQDVAVFDRSLASLGDAVARDRSPTGPLSDPSLLLDFRRLRANDILNVEIVMPRSGRHCLPWLPPLDEIAGAIL
jgi:hypothetical protein